MCPIFNLFIDMIIGCVNGAKKQYNQTFGPEPTPGPGQSLSKCSSSVQRYNDTLYLGERDRKIYEWKHEIPTPLDREHLRRTAHLNHAQMRDLCRQNREEMEESGIIFSS